MSTKFREIFACENDLGNQRSKYLARVFGIFSEEIVDIWANDEKAPYRNLGRPTLKTPGEARGHTLDFTLQCRATGRNFASEMKCEIEYQNFRYFVLRTSDQLDHHKKPAFDTFLRSARAPGQFAVSIKGQPLEIDGAILVWGAVDPEAKNEVAMDKGFHEILSLEEIRQDLLGWENPDYMRMVCQYRAWSNRLFDGLLSL